MPKHTPQSLGLIVLLLVCVAGAIATAIFTLRFGLLAERSPLSPVHTAIRLLLVLAAGALMAVRRDRLERVALLCGLIAAGSSALFGFGLRAPALVGARIIFHFLAYGLGTIALARLLSRCSNGQGVVDR